MSLSCHMGSWEIDCAAGRQNLLAQAQDREENQSRISYSRFDMDAFQSPCGKQFHLPAPLSPMPLTTPSTETTLASEPSLLSFTSVESQAEMKSSIVKPTAKRALCFDDAAKQNQQAERKKKQKKSHHSHSLMALASVSLDPVEPLPHHFSMRRIIHGWFRPGK